MHSIWCSLRTGADHFDKVDFQVLIDNPDAYRRQADIIKGWVREKPTLSYFLFSYGTMVQAYSPK
jgi:hypothetical protein